MSKNTQDILVSVVIPVHNRPDELKRAIQSVISQDYPKLEILVMDDASEVNLEFVIESFQDPRIRFFHHEKKSNGNVMRNHGLKEAKGEVIAFLDSDDEFLPDHLSNKLDELIKSRADGIYGSAFIDDGHIKSYAPSRVMVPSLTPLEYLLTIGFAQTSSWMVWREKALHIMFDESLHRHQDYDFFIRFAKKFKWTNTWYPGTIIHWKAGEKRQRHPGSEIVFIQRNASELTPRIYADYHLTRLGECINDHAPQAIINYYRRESERYIMQLSFLDYCSMYPNNKGFTGFLVNWFRYNTLILKRKFAKPSPPQLPDLS
ncbi:MAG: glycosyltransferase [Flavobacteriales bacterium]|nr:glycosyltransferase [Flavobacteriales bacterium]